MRWFKHFSDAHHDERLVEILEQYGLEGIGFWWMVCEIVAYQMDDSDKHESSYPIPAWARKFNISVRKTTAFFTKFSEINLILMEYDNSNGVGKLKIKIPKLLEFRDNYSKKRRTLEVQSTSSVRPKEVEVEVEVIKPLPSEKKTAFGKTEDFKKTFDWFWHLYTSSDKRGRSGNKKQTEDRMLKTITCKDDALKFGFAVNNYLRQVDAENDGKPADNQRALKLPEVFVNSWQGFIPEDIEAKMTKHKAGRTE